MCNCLPKGAWDLSALQLELDLLLSVFQNFDCIQMRFRTFLHASCLNQSISQFCPT